MSKKCKKAAVGLSFSGALSATIQFLPEDCKQKSRVHRKW